VKVPGVSAVCQHAVAHQAQAVSKILVPVQRDPRRSMSG
jgi:hypothetical protein